MHNPHSRFTPILQQVCTDDLNFADAQVKTYLTGYFVYYKICETLCETIHNIERT